MRQISRETTLFLLSIPFLVLVFIFSYIPLLGWIYAFFDYQPGIPLFQSPFVGFKYLTMMFAEWSQLGIVLRNTLVLSFITILTTPLPAVFAILLNEVRNRYFKRTVQTVTTLPNFISWIIVYGLFFSLFSLDGMFNQALTKAGILKDAFNFLGDPDIAWFLQICLYAWKTFGWSSIIYMASIVSIDQEQYDAARVDGAGRWRTILHVTVPGISSTFLVLLLLSISSMLSNGFDQYFVFNNSLVSDRLEVLDLYVYNMGIVYSQYSYSVAIGIWKTVLSILLLVFANTVSKRIRGDSIV